MKFSILLVVSPSILSLLALLFFSVARGRDDQTALLRWYQAEGARRIQAENWNEAWTTYRRIDQLSFQLTGSPDPEALLSMAAVAEQQDRPERVDRLMQRLLQVGSLGDVRAHRFYADLLASQTPSNDQEAQARLDALRTHLTAICKLDSQDLSARSLLADVSIALGDRESALRYLEEAATIDPTTGLRLVQLLIEVGRNDQANQWLQRTGSAVSKQLALQPQDPRLTIQLAACQGLAGQYELALQGLEQLEATPEVDQSKAQLFVGWAQSTSVAEHDVKLQRLLQALKFDPECRPAILALMSMTDSKQVRDELRPRLLAMVAQGGDTGPLHFMLGTLEALEGNDEQSRFHLDLAVTSGFRTASSLNNLAWSLAFGPMPDIERAVSLAQEAARIAPDHPEIQDTYGRILKQINRPAEAVIWLEKALSHSQNRSEIHVLIAECYQALGQAALAAEHQIRARETPLPTNDPG